MILVSHSTDKEGNIKDADKHEMQLETGVNRRIGLSLNNYDNFTELMKAFNNGAVGSLVFFDEIDENFLRTSTVMNIEEENDQLKVTTRNTIYYLIQE